MEKLNEADKSKGGVGSHFIKMKTAGRYGGGQST
jgi:hypothetical protein